MLLQVMGLEFNALSPHLLASAGLDGQLAIWDLTDPQKPKQYAPMKARPLLRHCEVIVPGHAPFSMIQCPRSITTDPGHAEAPQQDDRRPPHSMPHPCSFLVRVLCE